MKNVKKTVAVAMSGGVDSSVSAIILKNKGFNVIGLSMRLIGDLNNKEPAEKSCCSVSDLIDAKRVCVKLGIPHFVINLEDEFKENVIAQFTKEYLEGKTPNPCILCNKILKFDILLKRAAQLGADYLATGHYARITKKLNGGFGLIKAKDPLKDQSYVLYNLNQKLLSRLIFPVGNLHKSEIRKMALENGFNEISKKKDSVEICFIPDGNYHKFILEQLQYPCSNGSEDNNGSYNSYETYNRYSGCIRNMSGKIIGKHNGIFQYTIGQRKRLGISSVNPLYVIKIDSATKDIFVGTMNECLGSELYINDFNFINDGYKNMLSELNLTAKIRYSSLNYECSAEIINYEIPKTIIITNDDKNNGKNYKNADYQNDYQNIESYHHRKNSVNLKNAAIENGTDEDFKKYRVKITFKQPVKFITPGQSAVLYSGIKVIGGGVIEI